MTFEPELHTVGERCCLDEFKGTIRFIGEVPPTSGIWYGVEWDEPRGKHNGTLNGLTYFHCKDNHGSFARPHKVLFGIDATSVIQKTYGEGVYNAEEIVINEKSKSSEKVIQMVGFEKVALKQSELSSLKDVDLSSTNVSHASPVKGIEQICPNLTSLDLRRTLLSSFNEVFKMAGQLRYLKTLNISDNKITSWTIEANDIPGRFPQLQTLYINKVGINWTQLVGVLDSLPSVTEVHACYNLDITDPSPHKRIQELKVLNLEGSSIASWEQIKAITQNSSIEWLILNSNQLHSITFKKGQESCLTHLTSLSLSENLIEKWTCINQLRNIETLKELRFRNNPVCKGITSFQLRQELIARLDNVDVINGSKVESSERRVAEMMYVKKYSNEYLKSVEKEGKADESFLTNHPRYAELIQIHGKPMEEKSATVKLKENLLSITITCPDCDSKKPIVKKVPRTMTIQQLKGIVQRSFKVQNTKQKLSYLDKKNGREIELADNMKQLTYYSVCEEDTVYVRW